MSIESIHNETALVQEMQAGSEEAFTSLYRHYSPQLYMNILRMIHDPVMTEEIVQELFTRIWQKRASQGITENFAGYMYRVGQNLVHDFFRKLQRDRQLIERFSKFASENYEHIEEALHQQQSSAILQKAIDQLSPQQKKVYELVRQEGYTYKKTAEIMGISAHTVKEYLVAANKTIRNYLLTHANSTLALILFLAIYSRQ